MPTYTVKEIVATRPWAPTGESAPTRVYYDFLAEEVPTRINVGRKPSEALTVGMKLEGTLEDDQRGNGMKLVLAGANRGGGGPRPRDPKESAQIVRQHSQEMALRYAAIRAEKELLPEPFTLSDLAKVIDWFEKDAKAATP